MSMPPCSTPQRYPKPDVHTPLVGMTNSGWFSRASRSARSCANAAALVISSACQEALAAGATETICMPSTEPVTTPPPITDWSAARTVSAGALSEALAIEYAPAAVAPTAIAATISRPLTGTSCLRCRPRRPEMSMTSVAVTPLLVSVWLSRYACDARRSSRGSGRNSEGTASRCGIRSSVSCRSSSSGAWMTCDSRSNALFSRKSRSARSPNSLNGMMSVISAASGSIRLCRALVATPSGDRDERC